MSQEHVLPVALEHGFTFHRAEGRKAYLCKWIFPDYPSRIPVNCHHFVGVCVSTSPSVLLCPVCSEGAKKLNTREEEREREHEEDCPAVPSLRVADGRVCGF
mgnify:CR=1 FL=1